MKGFSRKWEGFIHVWRDWPWFRSAGIVAGTAAGLSYLNAAMPKEFFVDMSNPQTVQFVWTGMLILYFFLVAVFSGDRLQFEKRLRELEQNFRYDRRGTLYNGGETCIAFRVITFRGILEGISNSYGYEGLSKVLVDTGRSAGVNFSQSLGKIYDDDVARKKLTGKPWAELSLQEQLDQWCEYDSATGWGVLTCKGPKSRNESPEIIVTSRHLDGLYEGEGGRLFGYLLSGYCETVASKIIAGRHGGWISDYTGVSFEKLEQSAQDTNSVEIYLRLT